MLLLSEELIEYQLLRDTDVPQIVWDDAKVYEEDAEHCHYRMDVIWNFLSTMKSGDGRKKFSRLSKIAKLILVIPHSNAEEERVFSMVRKNKTPFRPNLDIERTLSSLLTVKLATNEPCHAYTPPDTVINRASKVTWEYNKQHSKNN